MAVVDIELFGCAGSFRELRELHCLFIGHSYFTHLHNWLTTAANNFYPNFGIDRIYKYSWLTYPGETIRSCKNLILQSPLLASADIIFIDIAGNDLDDHSVDEKTLIYTLISFVKEIRLFSPNASIVCLQLLKRFSCRVKDIDLYNEQVIRINKYLRTHFVSENRIWWWSHKALWSSHTEDIFKRDGVHLTPFGLRRYMRSVRGAMKCVIKAHY